MHNPCTAGTQPHSRHMWAVWLLVMLTAWPAIVITAPPAAALPPPAAQTQVVTPTLQACAEPAMADRIECGAARTARWLDSIHASTAVQRTVLIKPTTGGVWRSTSTGGVCGFVRISRITLGVHHCDGTTFIDPVAASPLLTDDIAATIVLAHEATHGLQELAGRDPVAATLSGDASRIKPLELSADCMAGIAASWMMRQHLLPPAASARGRALMGRSGSPSHGSSAERVAAFTAGLTDGRVVCEHIAGGVPLGGHR